MYNLKKLIFITFLSSLFLVGCSDNKAEINSNNMSTDENAEQPHL